eukprot:CAMPEP_0170598660 /NCGR_PEP_ID=MMETSP0224-20130122/16367_1 /TAXON_ID=285029 /ORGANISM="Togula jolla, Strain CCCM 725" /LENGTH=668 /DNA_ID=CAMNT_0010923229 /DNA_START=53 /DNA_END=2059 /DNA_ORIENTATION=-
MAPNGRVVGLLLGLGTFVFAQATKASSEDLSSLRAWQAAISSGLREMEQPSHTMDDVEIPACKSESEDGLRQWAQKHCGSESDFRCRLTILQDVKRFGRYEVMAVEGNVEEALDALEESMGAERTELEQKARQLQQMVDFLESDGQSASANAKFSAAEVDDQVLRAKAMSEVARVRVLLGVPVKEGAAKLDSAHACAYGVIAKPAAMYSGAPAEANPRDSAGEQLAARTDLLVERKRASALYMSSFTSANNRYAAAHPVITYVWLYVANLWAFMVPCTGSGPFMPEASSNFCFIGFLPWWNMFGPHVSCASPLGIITETVNPGASVWLTSSEFGLLTFSPAHMARSSCWMLPVVGQVGQIVPGRMLPDRTVFGSHPLGCSNMEGRPDIWSWSETYLSTENQGYDAELVAQLYSLAAQNASFTRATFFTTSLTQLALLGWYPQSTALQHHGVQLVLQNSSAHLPFKHNEAGSPSKAKVLTLEMMVEGLVWSIREQELAPQDIHSMEAYEFEHIPAEVVADFVLDQKGTTYKDANCQQYARNLMDRILTHGHGLKVSESVLGSTPEMTYRLIVLLAAMALAIGLSAVVQWAVCLRAIFHLRAEGVQKGISSRLKHAAFALADDFACMEGELGKRCGERVARVSRVALVLGAMVHSPVVFWYVIIKRRMGN